ncbi:MAG: protein-L-isoaspartate O-methyltransferase family protein [Promethearchaeota archaeon]
MSMKDFYKNRKKKLINALVRNEILKDKRLIDAFMEVNLEDFIDRRYVNPINLYADVPNLFYFKNEQNYRTISAPHMISIMLQGLALEEDDDLLILGAKSGYIAALAHKLAPKGEIYILEANAEIAKITENNLKKTKNDERINVIVKNPLEGMPELSPWQKILVTGAIEQDRIYPLLWQLDNEGVLYAPIGKEYIQIYTQIMRIGDDFYGKKQLQVRFTPLMTQLELDELELITDFNEVKIIDDPQKVENTLEKKQEKYINKINIKYAPNIFDDISLEEEEGIETLTTDQLANIVSDLEEIKSQLNNLKKSKEIRSCFLCIDEIEKRIEHLKLYKKIFDIGLKKLQYHVNQIIGYNLNRKDLENQDLTETEFLEKEKEIFQKQLESVSVLQDLVNKELKRLKKLKNL